MTKKRFRSYMIARINAENSWEHVAMNYIAGVLDMARGGDDVKWFTASGKLSRRNTAGRLALDLNKAMDNAMFVTRRR